MQLLFFARESRNMQFCLFVFFFEKKKTSCCVRQQRQRKKKLNKEIIQRDDTNGNAYIPSLQYLSTMALPDDDMNFIKNKTILEPNRIKNYFSSK